MKALGHLTDQQIAKLEAAGGKRWQKYGKDRIYINTTELGLEVSYYKTGNVSSASWQGEGISNADGRRLLASKVYVDVATGELSVSTSFGLYDDPDCVEHAAEKFVTDALAPEPEPELTDEQTIRYYAHVEGRALYCSCDGTARKSTPSWDEGIACYGWFGNQDDAEKAIQRKYDTLPAPSIGNHDTGANVGIVAYYYLSVERRTYTKYGDLVSKEIVSELTTLTPEISSAFDRAAKSYLDYCNYDANDYTTVVDQLEKITA